LRDPSPAEPGQFAEFTQRFPVFDRNPIEICPLGLAEARQKLVFENGTQRVYKLKGSVGVAFGIGTEPHENSMGISENGVHEANLLVPLDCVPLVDADLIDPDSERRLSDNRTEPP